MGNRMKVMKIEMRIKMKLEIVMCISLCVTEGEKRKRKYALAQCITEYAHSLEQQIESLHTVELTLCGILTLTRL